MRERLLQFFDYEHLPPSLREVSKPYFVVAQQIVQYYPLNPERTVCLRKLLEAKDAAVRCHLDVEPPAE